MINKKNIIIVIIYLFFITISESKERFVCKQDNKINKIIIINFFIVDNKIIMSGTSSSGTYAIVEDNLSGILALNVSMIGREYGVETILIDRKKKVFFIKSKLSSDKDKEVFKITGTCSSF